MTRHLAIDIGNSRLKMGFFVANTLVDTWVMPTWQSGDIVALATNLNTQNVILSSVVAPAATALLAALQPLFPVLELGPNTALGFRNAYQSPQTLGRDRLAAAAGAIQCFPRTCCLVVDAGTCITFDVVDATATYWGGNIAPGISMRLNAMHTFTDQLPLVALDPTAAAADWIGTTTTSALHNGALIGAQLELAGYAHRCRQRFGDVQIVLTGGDGSLLAQITQETTALEPHLVLIGLNKILNDHVQHLA